MADILIRGNGFNGRGIPARTTAPVRIQSASSKRSETARRLQALRQFASSYPRVARLGRRIAILLAIGGLVALCSWSGLLHAIVWLPIAIFG